MPDGVGVESYAALLESARRPCVRVESGSEHVRRAVRGHDGVTRCGRVDDHAEGVHAPARRRTVEPGIAESEDAAVEADEVVPLPVRGRGHADDGHVEANGTGGAVEGGVAVAEDSAVGRDEPVAVAVSGRRHPDDGLVEHDRPGRAVERGVAVAEDAAVGRDEPVSLAARRRCHADDGLVQVDGTGRTVERGVAVAEDAAVGRDEPVAVAVSGRRHPHDRLGEPQVRKCRRPQCRSPPMGRHCTRRRHRPVATGRVSGHHDAAAVVVRADRARCARRTHARRERRGHPECKHRNQHQEGDGSSEDE